MALIEQGTFNTNITRSIISFSSQKRRKIEEEEDNKKIYVWMDYLDFSTRWFVLYNNNKEDFSSSVHLYKDENIVYPEDLLQIRGFSCTILDSKIYFLGGCSKDCYDILSDKMFIFNTEKSEWVMNCDSAPSMKEKRFRHRVVAAKGNVFVFGRYAIDSDINPLLPGDRWGECFDSKKWDYLPKGPEALTNIYNGIGSHAVHGDEIFLWVDDIGLFSYNMETKIWGEIVESPMSHGPRWSSGTAVVDDVLYWFFCGNIYAYDFNKDKTYHAHRIEGVGKYYGESIRSRGKSYVVHVGGGMLCCVWWQWDNVDYKEFRCCRLKIKRSPEGIINLVPDGHALIHPEASRIAVVLTM